MNIYACLLTETLNLWYREIAWSLTDMGHRVFIPRDVGLNDSWHRNEAGAWSFRHRQALGERLLKEVREIHQAQGLDLFLAYVFPFQFDARVFQEIEKRGIPTVLLYCDNLSDYTVVEETSRHFTLTWVPEADAVALYKKHGRRFLYLPLGVNPNFNKPLPCEEKRDLVCVASRTPYRRWLLGSVISRGLPLEVYGNDWRKGATYYRLDAPVPEAAPPPLSFAERAAHYWDSRRRSAAALLRYGIRSRIMRRTFDRMGEEFEPLFQNPDWGYPVAPERMVELFSESKVTLGINHYVDPGYTDLHRLTFSKLRDFEAPMSGACYLTQYTPELDAFYPVPETIATYRTLDELCEKAKVLLKDKELRDRMRSGARRFCLENHTWANRFRVLFEKLGLKEKALSR